MAAVIVFKTGVMNEAVASEEGYPESIATTVTS
jgi:hypothetical protein